MRRLVTPIVLALSLSLAACAGTPAKAPASVAETPAPQGPPRLIVAVSIDQFSADTFAQYRQHYSGGFVRLINGVVFPSGFQSHAATETCPGHSTLLTGARPARNGIIANNWYEPGGPRGVKPIYCAEDDRDPASSAKNPVVSPYHLKVPTLGEWMKSANPATRNVAVSAKDRAVMMMGGHNIDAAWWWKGGAFVTLNGRTTTPAVDRSTPPPPPRSSPVHRPCRSPPGARLTITRLRSARPRSAPAGSRSRPERSRSSAFRRGWMPQRSIWRSG